MKFSTRFALLSLAFSALASVSFAQSCDLPSASISGVNKEVTISHLQPGQVVEISGGLRQKVAANANSVTFSNLNSGRHFYAVYPSEYGRSSVTPISFAGTRQLVFTIPPASLDALTDVAQQLHVPISTGDNLINKHGPLSTGVLDGSDYLKSDKLSFGCYAISYDKKLHKNIATIQPAMGTGTIYKELIAVNPNTWYVYNVWARAAAEKGRETVSPRINLIVNGADATAITPLKNNSEVLSALWYSGDESFLTLEIRNQNADPSVSPIVIEKVGLFNTNAPYPSVNKLPVVSSRY